MKQRLRDILTRNGYLISLTETPEGAILSFPDGHTVEYVVTDDGIKINGELVRCPEYAVRVILVKDVIREVNNAGFSEKIVQTFDQDGQVADGDLFFYHRVKDEERHYYLWKIYKQLNQDGDIDACFHQASDYGVVEGLEVVTQRFEQGMEPFGSEDSVEGEGSVIQ